MENSLTQTVPAVGGEIAQTRKRAGDSGTSARFGDSVSPTSLVVRPAHL